MPPSIEQLQERLKTTMWDLGGIGLLLVLLGACLMIDFASDPLQRWLLQGSGLLLVGPGAWYITACVLIGQHQFRFLPVTVVVAALQLVALVVALGSLIGVSGVLFAPVITSMAISIVLVFRLTVVLWGTQRILEWLPLLMNDPRDAFPAIVKPPTAHPSLETDTPPDAEATTRSEVVDDGHSSQG